MIMVDRDRWKQQPSICQQARQLSSTPDNILIYTNGTLSRDRYCEILAFFIASAEYTLMTVLVFCRCPYYRCWRRHSDISAGC